MALTWCHCGRYFFSINGNLCWEHEPKAETVWAKCTGIVFRQVVGFDKRRVCGRPYRVLYPNPVRFCDDCLARALAKTHPYVPPFPALFHGDQ